MLSTSANPPASSLVSRWVGPVGVLLQLLLVLYTFHIVIFHPGENLIVDHYDGIKSYYSVEMFLRQPLSDGMVMTGHNYPFGEYMYYTDSTPLLSEALHVLVRIFPGLLPYGLYIYDLVILSGLVLATGLLHRILRPWRLPVVLHLLACLALPWLSPQTIRLQVGHMSLSYAPAVLIAVWALQEIYSRHAAGRPLRGWLLVLGASIFVTSFWHFYYLAILGALVGLFAVVWGLDLYRANRPWWPVVSRLLLTLAVAGAITGLTLILLDGRYSERPTGSNGYDWIGWKLHFRAFFQAPGENHFRFLFDPTESVPYESAAYLGAMVLYTLVVWLGLRLFKRQPQTNMQADVYGRFLGLLVLASIPMVFMALGERYELQDGAYVIHNYFNPLFWLHKITERVTQFRAIGRYVWPFWWALNLLVVWLLAQWGRRATLLPVRVLAVVLALLLIPDLAAAVRFYRKFTQRPNLLTWPAARTDMDRLTSGLPLSQYQAILPIPYYHAGSEGDYSYTVDPDDPHCNHTYQLSVLTNLPLMSHKAVRTPPYQAQQLYSIFSTTGPDPALLARLDERPILVFLDSTYYNGSNNYYRDNLKDRAGMLAAFERGDDFVRERQLQLLRREGAWSLYAWYPKRTAPKP
ncbi:hypothetical protein HER32_00775 [Hymenobacter sp. BT18]|uniref:hypothetical protein n=1 Tax=Hymenobacter sp. BT18 TaxID=2835648 RepID=UPI00143E82B1|nr:hypothetical protein [Hymenobacter sp. BT18]QIX59801.1 hypothetical protein HER32_00775 [Hymenobacter sp. BT18]